MEADELFSRLGYKKIEENEYWIAYEKKTKKTSYYTKIEYIEFNLMNKTVGKRVSCENGYTDKDMEIKLLELYAINRKFKELNCLEFCNEWEHIEADKAFEKLGYEKIEDGEYWIDYEKESKTILQYNKFENISFNLKRRTVKKCACSGARYNGGYAINEVHPFQSNEDKRFRINELQAINRKLKDLGWRQLLELLKREG